MVSVQSGVVSSIVLYLISPTTNYVPQKAKSASRLLTLRFYSRSCFGRLVYYLKRHEGVLDFPDTNPWWQAFFAVRVDIELYDRAAGAKERKALVQQGFFHPLQVIPVGAQFRINGNCSFPSAVNGYMQLHDGKVYS
jgi:hypothetical protein